MNNNRLRIHGIGYQGYPWRSIGFDCPVELIRGTTAPFFLGGDEQFIPQQALQTVKVNNDTTDSAEKSDKSTSVEIPSESNDPAQQQNLSPGIASQLTFFKPSNTPPTVNDQTELHTEESLRKRLNQLKKEDKEERPVEIPLKENKPGRIALLN